MEQLLRQEISGVINQIQRYEAPLCTEDEGTPQYNDTNEHLFSVVDARDDDTHFIKTFNEGAVHYINGKDNTVTYCLRFICYDMMNIFTDSHLMTVMGTHIKAD